MISHFFPSDMEKREQGACQEAGHTLTILPDEKILFCCGHIINSGAQAILTVDRPGFLWPSR
jgi:hypothetical protein